MPFANSRAIEILSAWNEVTKTSYPSDEPKLAEEIRLLRAAIEHLTAAINDRRPESQLRHAYSCEQFALEILDGARTARWVAQQCRARRIRANRVVPGAPYIIPGTEAAPFLGKS